MSHLRQDFLRTLEAGTVGLFLVQAVRFTYASLYARASSADLVQRVPNRAALQGVPGVVELSTVQGEIVALLALLLLPLTALLVARWRWSLPLAVILVALGRSMALQSADLQVTAASLVIGAGLLYLTLTIIRRPMFFPTTILLGFAGDQFIRALGDTYDRTWQTDYRINMAGQIDIEMGIIIAPATIALILLALLLWYLERRADLIARRQEGYAPPLTGQMNAWGGLSLGAIFFLEFTLLALPNAVARWADVPYAGVVPWLLGATLLPLVPEVRAQAARFAGMFDAAWRGWLWALLLSLLLVVGRRYDGLPAALALVLAQFLVGLTLWWLVQTGLPRRNLTAIAILLCPIGFAALAAGDYFTYDYAYVRDLGQPYQNVDEFLRSFRGMGLGLTLVAALVLAIPVILWRGRIPWRGGARTLHLQWAIAGAGCQLCGRAGRFRGSHPSPGQSRLPARGHLQYSRRLLAILRIQSGARRPTRRIERRGHPAIAGSGYRAHGQLWRGSGAVAGPAAAHGVRLLSAERKATGTRRAQPCAH